MMMSWRAWVGALSGVVGAVVWAVSLAVYQPFMEPTDPDVGGNNTYWPRDVRQLAILLALGGVVLICRANPRAVVAGAVGAAGWLGVDLALDRADVRGDPAAVWLAIGGTVVFAGMVYAARKVSTGEPGSGQVPATVAAVAAAVTVLITTPWDEPVTEPGQVRVEDALTLLKAVLIVMLVAVAAGLVPLDRVRWMAPFAGLAVLAAWPATGTYGRLSALGLVLLPSAAAASIAAAREVPLPRLLAITVACAVALVPAALLLYFAGSSVGGAMTALAGNPAINSADSDLSLSFVAVLLGVLFAAISHFLTRPVLRSAPSRP